MARRCLLLPGLGLIGLVVLFVAGAAAQEPADPTTDAEVAALIRAAGTASDHPGSGAVIVLDRTRVQVEKSGLGHTHRHHIVKVLTDPGALAYTRLRFDYDPMSNTVDVKSVRIWRANGSVVPVPLNAMVDLPQPQHGIYWAPRMKLVPVPRLAPGDALEYRSYSKGFQIAYLGTQGTQGTRDTREAQEARPGVAGAAATDAAQDEDERYIPPMRGHYYDVVAFAAGAPIHRKHYTVETRREVPLQYEVYNGPVQARVTVTDKANIYSFWKERVPAHRSEPRASHLNDLVAKVVMATVPDWPAKSRWFFQVNEPQFPADDAIKAKVAELLEGKETDRDRIAALVHWCANEIRYSGVHMGEGEGYTVHPSTMTFHDRAGVCKDKAGIAVTMLREAGYTVYPALTMAGERVERVPADQFNHCVLAVKMDDKVRVQPDPALGVFVQNDRYWLLDPTWVVYSPELWSSAESEQHVVIGSPDGEELTVTPLRPATHNRIVIEGKSALKPGGLVEGSFTVTGTHYGDQRLRRYLMGTPGAEWRPLFEQWIANLDPEGELVDFQADYQAMCDVTRPIRYTLNYRLPGYYLRVGDQIRFAAPLSHHPPHSRAVAPYWGMASLARRTQPLMLWSTREIVYREHMAMPAGYKVKRLPPAVKMDTPAASLDAQWRQEGDGLVFEAVIQSRKRTVPAIDYAGFKRVVDAAGSLADHEIVLER